MTLRIEDVFGSEPRHGGRFWWPREKELEESFESIFNERTSKKVVLIDGPTGSGKTSIAYRTLSKTDTSFNYYSVDDETSWEVLCRHIISVPKYKEETNGRKLGFSIRNFLPNGHVDTNHEEKYDSLKELEYEESYLKKISLDDIVEILIKEKNTLLLDDFEKANDELIKKIANLSKKLSNVKHLSSKSKLIIISCRRSYEKLIESDNTLEGRVLHLTLGGIRERTESWKFILTGLELLDVKDPTKSRIKNIKDILKDCQITTYDATGGILKNLTDLGELIAKKAIDRKSISPNTIVQISKGKAQSNINCYLRKFDSLVKHIANDHNAREIIKYLYDKGINSYHDFADIQSYIERKAPETNVEEGISTLVEIDFLVPTGIQGSKLFTLNPNLSLAFCVALYRSNMYRIPKEFKEESKQLSLGLSSSSW